MNYYYELDPRSRKAFEQAWLYWCMPNCSPAEGGQINFKVHDEYVANSTRVWLENANGVYLVKPEWEARRFRVCPKEFTLIKLRAKNLYRAYDKAWE
jgi:hypothetical protein